MLVQRDARASVEDAAVTAGEVVRRDDLVLGVAEDALHRAL